MTYPKDVPYDESPEAMVENVPNDIIESALSSVKYGECPECSERQFYRMVAGHNSEHDCIGCGETLRIVG